MLKDEFMVDGELLKKMPLDVVIYARERFDHWKFIADSDYELNNQEKLNDRVWGLKGFIKDSTNWNLVGLYTEFTDDDFIDKKQKEPFNMQSELYNLILDIGHEKRFDIVVVSSISQLSNFYKDLKSILEEFFYKNIVVFCADTQKFVTLNEEIANMKLPKKLTIDYLLDSSRKNNIASKSWRENYGEEKQ